jgi:DNA/RNA endonuclease YhcR with UshA esterase domain
VTQVALIFSYTSTSGIPATGTVRFRAQNANASTAQTIGLNNGFGAVSLVVTESSTVYVVTEQIDHVSRQTYEITLPSTPATQNLAVLRPTT